VAAAFLVFPRAAAAMTEACDWRPGALSVPLARGIVDVWRVPLELENAELSLRETILAPDERQRAAAFRLPAKRREFVVARSALRRLLGALTGQDAASISLAYEPNGKPYLASPSATGIHFNVSHSGDLALIAVTLGHEIGVDVECVRPREAIASLAARYFAAAEADQLLALPESDRLQAFLACWTRKEAIVKAVGRGLALGLDRFQVTLLPGQMPRLLGMNGDAHAGRQWSLFHLDPAPGYIAAVALELPDCRVRTWQFVPDIDCAQARPPHSSIV
jgi:4'-phosphopantetheinyl transferase